MIRVIERTLILVKPDGVKRRLIGDIISRFERKGFTIEALKLLILTAEKAKDFYSPHVGKAFFEELVRFITSGPVVAAVISGESAVQVVRLMIGQTKSYEALPGTIRGDFGLGITDNIIHASDSPESFLKESKVIFE